MGDSELPATAEDSRVERPSPSRVDPPTYNSGVMWNAISKTPGVGISIMNSVGDLLFINETSCVLFFDQDEVDYAGKNIRDFHPAEFVTERLEMIDRVLAEQRPLVIRHIYHGRKIESTVWPLRDDQPPFNRVIVVTHVQNTDAPWQPAAGFETYESSYIDLGPLSVLTKRELEVLALIGHGLSVPRVAAILHRSPKTIERHKDSISQKLHAHGQAELVGLVTSMGLDFGDANLKRYSARPS